MRFGMRITTTYPVRCKEGFIPPGTDGEVQFAAGTNAYVCKFTRIEMEIMPGEFRTVTTTATVLADSLYKIPRPE